MSIRAGVIVAIAFQKVDRTPDAETGTERHNEGLKNTNCRIEKCHNKVPPKFYCLEGTLSSFQDQAALSGGSLPIGQGNIKGFKPFARLQFELGGEKTLYVEGVFLIKIR